MSDSDIVKFGVGILSALVVAGCVPLPTNATENAHASAEETFREAARHCHSKQVFRMRAGMQNVFYVGGLVDARTGKRSGADEA
jgi:HSP90 family molecular chaperone